MVNEIIKSEFLNKVRSAVTSARNVAEIDHAGVRGKAREIFVKSMLKPILPPYVEFGSGKITDSKGNFSSEVDVVIYSRSTLPPLLFEAGFGLYPAEACIYAIEVKSKLTREELRTTFEKFDRLKTLDYLPPGMDDRYQPYPWDTPPVIPLLFAFSTDLSVSGKDELDRYREIDENANEAPAIPVICVAGRGYWRFQQSEPAEKWIKHPATEDFDEVIDLIGGIANTIPIQIALKGRPRFGFYIINPRNGQKM